MARIIYKERLEGLNRLECIEGIEIDLLNGQKALIYPRYSNEELLDQKDWDRWLDAGISETAALRLRDNQAATAALLEAESQASGFVTKFTSERFGRFGLPALLAALEITEQKSAIDELARKIDGADLLEDFSFNVWSCSRFNQGNGWIAYGSISCAYSSILDIRNVAVPLILLDAAAGVTATARKTNIKKDNDMEVKRYFVSAERGQRVERFWFRTEEEARDKLTDLLAARGADWDIRMRRLDDADLERERRIFGAS